MKLAIVTACPNGKISSVLSARLLDAAAQRQGWSTSVECTIRAHPEKQLSPGDHRSGGLGVLVVNTGTWTWRVSSGKRLYQATPRKPCRTPMAFCVQRGAGEPKHMSRPKPPRLLLRSAQPRHGGSDGVPDRRRPHLYGRRGDSAGGQESGL